MSRPQTHREAVRLLLAPRIGRRNATATEPPRRRRPTRRMHRTADALKSPPRRVTPRRRPVSTNDHRPMLNRPRSENSGRLNRPQRALRPHSQSRRGQQQAPRRGRVLWRRRRDPPLHPAQQRVENRPIRVAPTGRTPRIQRRGHLRGQHVPATHDATPTTVTRCGFVLVAACLAVLICLIITSVKPPHPVRQDKWVRRLLF